MIEDRAIQRFLAARGAYRGAIDGLIGSGTKAAMRAVLQPVVTGASGWDDARLRIATEQLMMREVGIETGAIDGFDGPQTRFALEQWQNRLRDITPPVAEVKHQPSTFPRQSGVPGYYGKVGVNQVTLELPFDMRLAWNTDKIVRQFSIHRLAHDSAKAAFAAILAHYGEAKLRALGLDLFGGCLNVRKMRGGSNYSMHSWGIAIDFDPTHNQLHWGRDRARMAGADYAAFLDIWEGVGWISLGRERNFDWMHVQAARL